MEERERGKQDAVASVREIFRLSGPLYLNAVDWENLNHRKSVAASLVQGVYILERDRQQKRQGNQSHASPWWNFFHFQLVCPLIDDVDFSIFGAIYEHKSFGFSHNAPKYVIAFRGTLNKPDSRLRDAKLDIQAMCSKLHQSSRFQLAMQAVKDVVATVGPDNIWLAGHSLGSAIALLVGKNMTKLNYPIETYLFNPPFFSVPIECISNKKVKHGIRMASSVMKAGIAVAVKGQHHGSGNDDPFFVLSDWVPYLFVNPGDHICSEYIGYFQHRKKMEEVGATKIERLAMQNSIGNMICSAGVRDCEPLHLLPSAYLTINMSQSLDFRRAHGIHQWWDPSFDGQSKLHLFRVSDKNCLIVNRLSRQLGLIKRCTESETPAG
ncbi:GDSL esterase/lipase At4g10955-like [Mangifera indica]|uniref:GDSL esterase/lipase At4g10955-like n=1 Tax=Mangifera indica TaxID=29780 RepID=UPI001CFB9D4D|nr:GDSL esterase/lipase At4g10955-like [Mangifera indica]XP_044473293.1 GDSL esterase/lipase At4g10955-like [Mangifera indica]XP_044473294.1 GDSL esterase/lipase At4g10955-like [Mangifera indica]